MSLNRYKWELREEKEIIILKKIKKEIQKAFLTTKENVVVRFWIGSLVKLIAKNLSLKEDTVKKCIEILLIDCFIFKDHISYIYYYPEITEELITMFENGTILLDYNNVFYKYAIQKLR